MSRPTAGALAVGVDMAGDGIAVDAERGPDVRLAVEGLLALAVGASCPPCSSPPGSVDVVASTVAGSSPSMR